MLMYRSRLRSCFSKEEENPLVLLSNLQLLLMADEVSSFNSGLEDLATALEHVILSVTPSTMT